MYRLKMTLKDGREFLGPFVYNLDKESRKKKLKKMHWVCKDEDGKQVNNLEFIKVTKYPKKAIYNSKATYWFHHDFLMNHLKMLENEWDKLMKEEEENE